MVDPLNTFVKEQRHIFGVCPNPDCRHISRLAEIAISYKSPYAKDWMDKTEAEVNHWELMKVALEGSMKALKEKAVARARRTVLPKRLASISPFFVKPSVKAEDIKVLLDPIDFIGFDGLITEEDLRRVVLLDSKETVGSEGSTRSSIERTVENGHYDWSVLRVGEDGKITSE